MSTPTSTPAPSSAPDSAAAPAPQRGRGARSVIAWTAFAVLTALVLALGSAGTVAAVRDDRRMVVVAIPHPDDEFQTWSLIEDRPNDYTVFVVFTRGEGTGACEPEAYRTFAEEGLDPDPTPLPTGRGTVECAEARMNSLIGYLSAMSLEDPGIPGDFGAPVPAADGTSLVWTDRQDRGAVVSYDLGDGNLTEEEVIWALTTTLGNREALGLDVTSPIAGIVGSFANTHYDCFSYPHPDHVAVHRALWDHDFGVAPQFGATCASDPDRSIHREVSDAAVEAAFRIGDDGERLGAHTRNYGWLFPGYYEIDLEGQELLFTRNQYFWVRFND